MKVVVNDDWGGFSIPKEVVEKLGLQNVYDDIDRSNPELVKWVEEHPDGTSLVVREIPDGSFYVISDYDGVETIYYSSSEIGVCKQSDGIFD